jgi:hypothetical protein
MVSACEAGGTLSSVVISELLLQSVKVPPSETAAVCGNTAVVDGCF